MRSEVSSKLGYLSRRRVEMDRAELEWSRLAAEVAASGEHQAHGFFNPVDWLRVTCAMGEGMVRDRITVGRQMSRLPLAVAAVESGEIGFGHLVVLARTAEALRDRPVDEARLLRAAREQTVGRFHYTCESYRHAADAQAFAQAAEELHEKRELMIRRRRDGMFTIWGRLEPVTGSALRAALAPHAHRRGGDHRTFPQRLHDAVAEHLAGRQTTSVNVTVSLDTVLAVKGSPAGEIQGAPLIAQPTVERLLCDCAVRRIVLDPGSLVVDVGRSRRVVTPAGRSAVESRESGVCGCPGCDRPGRTIHHLKPWSQGGSTDLPNQVLLCYWHHRMVHEGGWRLARQESGELLMVRPPPDFRSDLHGQQQPHDLVGEIAGLAPAYQVTAPSDALLTSAAYLAITPVR